MPSTVFEQDGRFCARLPVKGRQVWLGRHETREAAERAVQAERDRLSGVYTVAGWLEVWASTIAGRRRRRQEETVRHTTTMLRGFVDQLGHRQLAELTRQDVVMWAVSAPAALRYAKSVLADAVWAGVLESSPADGVNVSTQQGQEDDGSRVPTTLEVAGLVKAAPTTGLGAFVLAAAWSGMRLGEVAALETRDLHAGDGDTLLVDVRSGKGGRARQVVLFRPGAVAVSAVAPAGGLIFRNAYGHQWDRKSISKRWCGMRDGVPGTEDVTFHGLRKFHATWLLDQGASDLDVAVQLGHTDRRGQPNADLVRRVYGRPDHSLALGRIAEMVA